ncbi:hypothetical protein EYZ11_010015 [Aspergillus tanneri]|uniref:Altered inheritance of mitochondria protein 11 n=1 Tax=Aspergillus tanneri TaxID=1220188 RepID=A0A4S3JBT5_9EURO|nr:uncharacterized protein ATNIH1004_007265 [Aspergillus tanneri]KAA8645844.1 hypothetical protein ATNIH1004_007265 [Aspergillus tanneri]THC90531.1 hypothetical protein EYZ11_010015 [Aspergillus tanneri]
MFSLFSKTNPQSAPENTSSGLEHTTPTQPTETKSQTIPKSSPEPEAETFELRFIKPNTKYKLLFGGLAFLAFSLASTRRALRTRYVASIPPFYTSSVFHRPQVNGGTEAFEALSLATLNVISVGMVASGAALWALDINAVDDMRRYVRRGYADGGEVSKMDEELEEEVAQWVGSVLGKKFEREVRKEQERTREK